MRLPDFAADPATRRFNSELYEEHLEEASFLSQQRLALHDDPEVSWLAIGEFESRLEAHLDALVSGQDLALDICTRRADEGDPGELYAAACVFCRQRRRDLLGRLLKKLDTNDAARTLALSEALKDEMPAEWAEALAAGLARGYEKLVPMMAHYAGCRRLAVGHMLVDLMARVPSQDLAQVIWCLGRLRETGDPRHVVGYLDHDDSAVRTNAALALLRRGGARTLISCRERAARGDLAMALPIALSGGRSDGRLLQQLVLTADTTSEQLIGLGLLGEVSAIPLLLDRLRDPGLAPAAATGLELITGADLREQAFIPEVVDESELFEDELETYRKTGTVPQHVDDRPFGVSVERRSMNPDDWSDWWHEHQDLFEVARRYRLGKPFSLAMTVSTLVSPAFGRQVRVLANEELVIRYGIDVPLEPVMRVNEQKDQINAISRLCRAQDESFLAGEWYFAGEQLP